MATLLNGVNEVLKRVSVIQGDTTSLASLTQSGIQPYIDIAVQVWNEGVEELYTQTDKPMPKELASSSITLVASDRDYSLASDLIQIHWPLQDTTNGDFIYEFPGGFLELVESQPIPANHTGLPQFGAIRESDGEIYLDALPTSSEAGRVYTYYYDKDISLSAATDTFPFNDVVYRAMIPAVAQLWRRDRDNSFDEDIFKMSMGRAGRALSNQQPHESWGPHRVERRRFTNVDFQTPFGRD